MKARYMPIEQRKALYAKRDAALAVPCPRCGALKGNACLGVLKRNLGIRRERWTPHIQRTRLLKTYQESLP